jgi:hypothetical protein
MEHFCTLMLLIVIFAIYPIVDNVIYFQLKVCILTVSMVA